MNETEALVPKPKDLENLNRFPSVYTLLREGVVLDNVGSTARDHLANERTFLAWVRTALSILGVGIGLLKWQGIANASAYLVLSLGTVVLVTCTLRYLAVMQQLAQYKFVPNVKSTLAVVASILVVIISLLIMHLMHKL